jgi:hypothetical protein
LCKNCPAGLPKDGKPDLGTSPNNQYTQKQGDRNRDSMLPESKGCVTGK